MAAALDLAVPVIDPYGSVFRLLRGVELPFSLFRVEDPSEVAADAPFAILGSYGKPDADASIACIASIGGPACNAWAIALSDSSANPFSAASLEICAACSN